MKKETRGRKKRWHERMVAAFPEGTFWCMEEVLGTKEDRTDLVRTAVQKEIKHRWQAAGKGLPPTARMEKARLWASRREYEAS